MAHSTLLLSSAMRPSSRRRLSARQRRQRISNCIGQFSAQLSLLIEGVDWRAPDSGDARPSRADAATD
jgi:hypothetical protein